MFASGSDLSILNRENEVPNKFEPTEAGKYSYPSVADVSERVKGVRAGYEAEEADYMATLSDVDARQKLFSKFTNQDPHDHSEINKVKAKIASLIQHEIGEMDFKNQIGSEEIALLE